MSEYQRLKNQNHETKEIRKELRQFELQARRFAADVQSYVEQLVEAHLFDGHEVGLVFNPETESFVVGCKNCDSVFAQQFDVAPEVTAPKVKWN